MDQQVNFLEIIGRLYVQAHLLERSNQQLDAIMKKQAEEQASLIEMTNKLSMPRFSGEKTE